MKTWKIKYLQKGGADQKSPKYCLRRIRTAPKSSIQNTIPNDIKNSFWESLMSFSSTNVTYLCPLFMQKSTTSSIIIEIFKSANVIWKNMRNRNPIIEAFILILQKASDWFQFSFQQWKLLTNNVLPIRWRVKNELSSYNHQWFKKHTV